MDLVEAFVKNLVVAFAALALAYALLNMIFGGPPWRPGT